MRVVIVSNTTMDPIKAHLVGHDVVCSGTGDFISWLASEDSPAAGGADLVAVHCDADSIILPLGAIGSSSYILDVVERFARHHPETPTVVTTLMPLAGSAIPFSDPEHESGVLADVSKWNGRLAQLAHELSNLHVLDLTALLYGASLEDLASSTYWYLGRIRFSALGFEVFGTLLNSFIRGLTNQARKVLVLDLDNTLWGGVVGEVGIGGIDLSEDGVGKCYRDFQKHIEQLQRDGTLLCIVSKNDAQLVEQVLSEHPMMVLRSDAFVVVRADWTNKADHISAIAGDLGLGLDSFVFLDDNPVERELVRTSLPSVAVPEFPDGPQQLARWFSNEVARKYFPRVQVLPEDHRKTEQYRAREQRHTAELTDLDGFLDTLAIDLTFRSDEADLVPRLSQLSQKTNQFNLTGVRLTATDLAEMVKAPSSAVISVDYSDRFGDEGTIGLAIVDVAAGRLENLLLSCRVIGRGVEDALLRRVEQIAADHGHTTLTAKFIASDRNAVASSFLPRRGFVGDESHGTWIGTKELM